MPMRYYDLPRKYRNCANCVHLDQPLSQLGGFLVGGCRKRLMDAGYTDEAIKKHYCVQWFLRLLNEEDY